MTQPTNTHPTAVDLFAALQAPDRAPSTLEHLRGCVACSVRSSRIREVAPFATPSVDSLDRIAHAATALPAAVVDIVSRGHDEQAPRPNEIWRIGRDEALLVWVRRVFGDGVADVIPLVLDVEMADQESVMVSADCTPLATETVAMVALRTHVCTEAFINRVGELDIGQAVADVMAAAQEGRRARGVRVGPPIDGDHDQRLEYRQALRDFLYELTPDALS